MIRAIELFRPVGMNELKLIHDSGMRAFPPRLPEQPIFYPVMNRPYAIQIARDWNSKSEHNRIGFVLGFRVDAEYVSKFAVQVVGGREHQELWVPAEELEEFNRNIVAPIEILDVFRGEGCTVELDEKSNIPKAWLASPDIPYEGKFLRIKKIGRWEFAQRTKATGIVATLAITDEGKVVFIEQFRPPLNRIVVEIPAGLAGDVTESEPLDAAARRELLEETGYEAKLMDRFFEGPSSAGLTDETITFFRAGGMKKTAPGVGDGSEKITVFEIPFAEVHDWLQSRQALGHAIDCRVYTALYFELHSRQ
jgi:ADP-ribose pyrophosphatase